MKKSWDAKVNILQDNYSSPTPATIQPHGVLLALGQPPLRIENVSANTANILGISPAQLIGQPLTFLLSEPQIDTIKHHVPIATDSVLSIELSVITSAGPRPFQGCLYAMPHGLVLELEPTLSTAPRHGLSVTAQVRDTVVHLQRAESLDRLLTTLVNDLQEFTDYQRVMVYKFDHQGSGEVIAEAKVDSLPSYLGLHFPATDIPDLSREFYARGQLRVVPDIAATPVPLLLSTDAPSQSSVDLSLSSLRSPSPCCVEYYGNMGVNASLVASLIKDRQLWGLISCHHTTAKFLPHAVRSGCEIITQMAAAELANKIRQDQLKQQAQLSALNSELIAAISQAPNFLEALTQAEERLLGLVNATGVAIVLGDELRLIGTLPAPEAIGALLQWADREVQDTLFHTNCLAQLYPEANRFQATGSGLLRLKISHTPCYQLLWFREEVLQMVTWAGNPDQHLMQDEQGALSPRNSFEQWREAVYGQSLPWQPFELNAALDLRNAIVGIVLQKADELTQLNRELEQRNHELSSFAYAAAHDLKEPLRGIYNYSNVLIEDYSQVLDQDGNEYLQEMQGFAQHMEALLNGLLRIAQLRQADLQIEPVDLNGIVNNVVNVIQASQPDTQFEVRLPQILPQIECDEVLINEVFSNLVGNAIKYNNKPEKWVEIGYDTGSSSTEPIFYVRDNGIGIKEKHRPVIFKLFKRLHPHELYGGGAGVGLAVTHQIIERHNGTIWVESTPTEGSTFFFRLKHTMLE